MSTGGKRGFFFIASCVAAAVSVSVAAGDEPEIETRSRAALDQAKISVVQAMAIAQRVDSEGSVVQAELKLVKGTPVHEVFLARGPSMKVVLIDATQARVSKVSDIRVAESRRRWMDGLLAAIPRMTIPPAYAIRLAEREVEGGKTLRMSYEQQADRFVCAVWILGPAGFVDIRVDPYEGAVIKESPSELVEPGPRTAAWDFDADEIGRMPSGWKRLEAQADGRSAWWTVVEDASAPGGQRVFAMTRADNHGETFNVAVADGSSFKDVDLTVKVKAIGGKEDQGGGPVWRCKDAGNYYVCRFNPLEGDFCLYLVESGRRKPLASAKIETTAGRWYGVRATMVGDRIVCYLDDQKLLEAQDGAIKDAGMIGAWTKADAATAFDAIRVAPISETSPVERAPIEKAPTIDKTPTGDEVPTVEPAAVPTTQRSLPAAPR